MSTAQERIEQLEQTVRQLEQRITKLEGGKAPSPVTVEASKKAIVHATPVPTMSTIEEQQIAREPIETPEMKQEQARLKLDFEQRFGQVWLPRIFIFVLLFGVAWGLKASIDYGLLSRPIRIVLGLLTTGALLYIGDRQMKEQRPALGQMLLGASVVVSTLTVFAAHMLYNYIPAVVAFPLNVALIGGGVYLSQRYRSQSLAILASFVGVIIPFLIESKTPNAILFASYEALLYLAFLVIAVRNNYRILYYCSAVSLQCVLMIFALMSLSQVPYVLPSIIAVSFVQHAALVVLFLRAKQPISEQIGFLLASLALSIFWFQMHFHDRYSEPLTLIITFVYLGLSYYLFHRDRVKFEVTAIIVLLSFSYFITLMTPFNTSGILLLLTNSAAIYLGMRWKSKGQMIIGALLYGVAAIPIIVLPLENTWSSVTLQWLVLLGTSASLLYTVHPRVTEQTKNAFEVGLGIFTFLLLVFDSRFVMAATQNWNDTAQTLTLSTSWLVWSIAFITVGMKRQTKWLRLGGIVILMLTLTKAILFDASFVSLPIRALSFIILGAIGLVISRFYYQQKR